jgi:hypothetical protein
MPSGSSPTHSRTHDSWSLFVYSKRSFSSSTSAGSGEGGAELGVGVGLCPPHAKMSVSPSGRIAQVDHEPVIGRCTQFLSASSNGGQERTACSLRAERHSVDRCCSTDQDRVGHSSFALAESRLAEVGTNSFPAVGRRYLKRKEGIEIGCCLPYLVSSARLRVLVPHPHVGLSQRREPILQAKPRADGLCSFLVCSSRQPQSPEK